MIQLSLENIQLFCCTTFQESREKSNYCFKVRRITRKIQKIDISWTKNFQIFRQI